MTNDPGLRVVIAGGGTGGHLFPGIAVARELLARRPDAVISFAGTARGIESRVIPKEGFPLDLIRSGGLKGKSAGDVARGLSLLPLGFADAWQLLSRRRPGIVIGVGGYSSGPVLLCAAARGIPTMLLEQNAVPGFTNRMLAPFVGAAAVTFDSTKSFFGAKGFFSGNPVRPEFFEAGGRDRSGGSGRSDRSGGSGKSGGSGRSGGSDRSDRSGGSGGSDQERRLDDAHEIRVLVFGGSQGAHAINVAMVEAAPELAAGRPRLRLTHQTGERDVEMVRDGYRNAGLQADVEPFLYDMAARLRQTDLVVSRAGMTTIAELTAIGVPAILIPLPTATDDHQRKNAEATEAAGAAETLLQSSATGAELARRILALAADAPKRARMSAAAKLLARPDAAKVIADKVMELARAR